MRWHSMVQHATTKIHVILTPSATLRACSGRHRAAQHRSGTGPSVRWFASLTMTWVFMGRVWRMRWVLWYAVPQCQFIVMLTGGRHLTAGQRSSAPQRTFIVILPPAATLRACSGRQRAAMPCCAMENNADSVRWFASLTMTWVFMGGHGGRSGVPWRAVPQCQFIVMLTGGRHRAAHHRSGTGPSVRWFASLTMTWVFMGRVWRMRWVPWYAVPQCQFIVMLTGGRHRAAHHRSGTGPSVRWFASLTMTWVFMGGHGGCGGIRWCAVPQRRSMSC
jgi:hypothetical protein